MKTTAIVLQISSVISTIGFLLLWWRVSHDAAVLMFMVLVFGFLSVGPALAVAVSGWLGLACIVRGLVYSSRDKFMSSAMWHLLGMAAFLLASLIVICHQDNLEYKQVSPMWHVFHIINDFGYFYYPMTVTMIFGVALVALSRRISDQAS